MVGYYPPKQAYRRVQQLIVFVPRLLKQVVLHHIIYEFTAECKAGVLSTQLLYPLRINDPGWPK